MNGSGGEYSGDPYYIDGGLGPGGDFRIEVPVGYPSVPLFWPRIVIPDLGKWIEITIPTAPVSEPFIGTIESPLPPHAEPIVDVVTLDGWVQNRAGGWSSVTDSQNPAYVPWSVAKLGLPGAAKPKVILNTPTAPIAGPVQKKETPVALDLGNLIGDIFGSYIDARYQPSPNKFAIPAGPDYSTTPPGVNGGDPLLRPALGFPGFDVTSGDSPGKGWLWKPATENCAGKWIKRGRRRRKRLATASDIRDIASLKNVGGPAFLKTWVATHPS